MRAVTTLVFVVIGACGDSRTAPGGDDGSGQPLAGCTSCGSGALSSVFQVDQSAVVAAGTSGTIAYTTGIQPPTSTLTWLAPDFSQTGETSFSPIDGITRGTMGMSIDSADSTYVTYVSVGDTANYVSLIGLAADHTQMFRVELGAESTDVSFVGDPAAGLAIYYPNYNHDAANVVTAVHTSDGSVAWTAPLDPAITDVRLGAAPDGTVVLTAETSSLELDDTIGSAGALTIAALDPATGSTKWQTQIAGASAPLLAIGPGGEIAVSMIAIDPVIDSQTIATDDEPMLAAMLEPTGALRWATPVSLSLGSIVTDGDVVDFAATDGGDLGYFGQVSASGTDWTQVMQGYGGHSTNVLAHTGSQVVSTVLTTQTDAQLIDGDVTVSGDGVFIVDLVL
jgi:PQQ-like domain